MSDKRRREFIARCGGVAAAWSLAAHERGRATIGATKAMTATLPQIEIVRVKPVDRTPPNLRLSNGLVDLMKGFSLSSSQGIGGAWETPPNIATPDAFAERYGRW